MTAVLSRTEVQQMIEGEEYGRELFEEAITSLRIPEGFDPAAVLSHFARFARRIRAIGLVRANLGSHKGAAAWALGGEDAFILRVRSFWVQMIRRLAEEHPAEKEEWEQFEQQTAMVTLLHVLPDRARV